jgi:hypothetical protein
MMSTLRESVSDEGEESGFRDRHEVARLMFSAVAADKTRKPVLVAMMSKARVIHGPLACGFGVLVIEWPYICPPRAAHSRRILRADDKHPERVAATARP